MKNILYKIGILTLLVSMLSGCSLSAKQIEKIPLVPELSQKEITDYYAKALSYDTITSRSINVHKVSYETKNVDSQTEIKIKQKVAEVENILKQPTYVASAEASNLITESNYYYIRSFLNDKVISQQSVDKVCEAIGFYFADVKYSVGAGAIGAITGNTALLGINGAFKQDGYGNDLINQTFITKAVIDANKYYADNKINKSVVYDAKSNAIAMYGNDTPAVKSITAVINNRIPLIDTIELNSIGSSKEQSAYMPNINLVYTLAVNNGIGGIGVYPSGAGGMNNFGFNRNQIKGTLTIRYVFKSDLNTGNIVGYNVYPTEMDISSGISVNTTNEVIPDFLNTELEKIIERSDRAISNSDISALMSGRIYNDVGMAIKTGFENKYVNILRNKSNIKRIVSRDTKNGAYLVEVETTRSEGTNGTGTNGVYKDKYYTVIEQFGSDFVITDTMLISRQMVSEPLINTDSTILKRLSALNLAGEVTASNKAEIKELMQSLYTASTCRVLNGPKDIQYNGQTTHIDLGMYDCFNNDISILSSTKKEYLNASIRQLLVKNGVNVGATYKGSISEWIGGNDRQAEFIANEAIIYNEKNTGIRMETYYLVSCIADKWVIDDIKVIEQEEVYGEQLNSIISKLDK